VNSGFRVDGDISAEVSGYYQRKSLAYPFTAGNGAAYIQNLSNCMKRVLRGMSFAGAPVICSEQ
jgi:hypothetical protein